MMDWSEFEQAVIGKPFEWNARGPNAYDCWGLVKAGLMFAGVDFPDDWYIPENSRMLRPVDIMESQIKSGRWSSTANPLPGDVVAMSTHRRIHHIGIVTPNGIVHAVPKTGVIRSSFYALKGQGYQRIEVYRWA